MENISSKYVSLTTVDSLLNFNEEYFNIKCDGILLIMPFGIIYGKFLPIDLDNPNTIADILLSSTSNIEDKLIKDDVNLIEDGSQIILKDATIKYSTGITLNMNEIIIFCDQVCGYYPIDLSTFKC